MGEAKQGPEARGQQSAATLEEAMALQDKLAREANNTAAEEGADARAEEDAEAAEAIEEAGKAQEARDDEVYGRVAGAEDRRPGVGETAVPATEEAVAEDMQDMPKSESQTKDTQAKGNTSSKK